MDAQNDILARILSQTSFYSNDALKNPNNSKRNDNFKILTIENRF